MKLFCAIFRNVIVVRCDEVHSSDYGEWLSLQKIAVIGQNSLGLVELMLQLWNCSFLIDLELWVELNFMEGNYTPDFKLSHVN